MKSTTTTNSSSFWSPPLALGTSTTGSTASPLVSSTVPPASEEPSPTDLLLATPPSLLKLFALLSPIISLSTTFCQLVTWQHPNFFASLLVLLAWWSVCLFGKWLAVYGFNLTVLIFITAKYFSTATKQAQTGGGGGGLPKSSSSKPPSLTPAAYSQLLTSSHFLFSHLHSFRTTVLHPLSLQFSFTPTRPSTRAPVYETARLLITSYPFYLLTTRFIPLRYIFLSLGSTAILWNAPFFRTFRFLVWKSQTVRWIVRLTVAVCFKGGRGFKQEWKRTKTRVGVPGLLFGRGNKRYATTEEKVVKTSSIKKPLRDDIIIDDSNVEQQDEKVEVQAEQEEEEEEEDVQVQFTVFENQRWWVGLDWTHALLPGERASWTDPCSNPSNPPSSFNLPLPQITYIPAPTSQDPHSRLKKITSWRWLDPEWKVLRESIPTVTLPVSPALPSSDTTTTTTTTTVETPPSPSTGNSIFSSLPSPPANLLLSASLSSSSSSNTVNPTSFSSPALLISDENSKMFENWLVDSEGWQYGDNHFEKMGKKGGLGKYTRRRAWVRKAGLVETTERVPGNTSSSRPKTKEASAASSASGSSGDKVRRKSETVRTVGSVQIGKSSSSARDLANQIRKRKSMPPSLGSEQSISKDVD